jgi:hypothetical protein
MHADKSKILFLFTGMKGMQGIKPNTDVFLFEKSP